MHWKSLFAGLVALVAASNAFAHGEEKHDAHAKPSATKETAFGRAADPTSAQRTVLVEMNDGYRFSPDTISVQAGEVIRFVVVNAGKQMHEMVLGTMKALEEHNQQMRRNPQGMHHDGPDMAHVAPGKSGVIVWQFTRPGEFFFACLVDDHFQMGMVGTIRVSGQPLSQEHGGHAAAPADAHAAHGAPHAMRPWFGAYPVTRESSGTSWQPDASPHEGIHARFGEWDTMTHGFANLIYDDQGGPRGDTKSFMTSMLMFMGNRAVGGAGTLGLRAMVSADPAFGKGGYPLLLQTGETADGQTPLIDRQHPHDLFMELSASYSHRLSERSSVFAYVGLPGEPALGPPAFMHRFSGEDNPEAPISHHWLDSTHITYGVVTLGYVLGDFKLEASAFRGREPDEKRYDIETGRLDSASVRLSYNPTRNWALQVSRGHIVSPEALHPDDDIDRTTASAIYHRNFASARWQTTFAWGRNKPSHGEATDAYLLESALSLSRRHTFFGRIERADKNELFLEGDPLEGETFRVSKLTLGYVHDFFAGKHYKIGAGGLVSGYSLPGELDSVYGSSPTSYMVFARIKLGEGAGK
jgi:uncharacterized cupredoxin-like copper-binding protein